MQPPPTHLLSHLLQSVLADRRQKRREHHLVLVARSACAKRVAQKRKRRVLRGAAPISVLAVHDFGFIGMQPQPDLDYPVFDRSPHLLSLLLANTMHDRVSSGEGSHLPALAEPDVSLSTHPAPIAQP